MNLPPSSESSLYRLTQRFIPACKPITVNSTTIRGVVKILVDLLLEEQLKGTVWCKLPTGSDWQEVIDRLQNQSSLDCLYVCNLANENRAKVVAAPTSTYTVTTKLTSLVLETSSYLKRECFLIVLSNLWQCVLITQKHLGEEEAPWQLVYSFEPALIGLILSGIKRDLTITDRTPEELLRFDVPIPELGAKAFPKALMSSLLLKHIQQTQESQNLSKSSLETIPSESSRFKEELLKNFAQEISIPLTNIKTALYLLESMQSKREQRQRYLDLLQGECEKQNAILSAVQEFIKLDQLSLTPPHYPRLEDLIPGIVSTYQPLAEERGILLGYTIPAGFPPVACPEPWLRQILLNLLSNSLKFTNTNGRVYVQASFKQGKVELTISDTGKGIESSEIPKIFNSFYRGKHLSVIQANSAGLGLTVVKQLLTRCGGTIAVNSKLERGTTFVLTLPINNEKDHF